MYYVSNERLSSQMSFLVNKRREGALPYSERGNILSLIRILETSVKEIEMVGRISKLVLVVFVVLGCTQFASAVGFTVGQTGADYTDINVAIAAVTETNTTIRFIDSATYEMNQLDIIAAKYEGLTIESAEGQKATISFSGAGNFCTIFGQPNQTLQNVKIVNNDRNVGVLAYGATDFVVKNVDFVNNVANGYLLDAGNGAEISYSTFYGPNNTTTGGKGISVNQPVDATVSVDHCSFDNFGFAPIHNGAGAILDVTNSSFGDFYSVSVYRKAIYIAGQLTEDYNRYYVDTAIAYPEGEDYSKITFGINTAKTDFRTDIFIGDTSAGDWEAPSTLYTAASDGTTIGAWQAPVVNPPFLMGDANGDGVVSAGDYAAVQANFGAVAPTQGAATPEPATMSLLVIGGIALLRRKRR
jgi:hypothetical protein